jgi:hypothetical protein
MMNKTDNDNSLGTASSEEEENDDWMFIFQAFVSAAEAAVARKGFSSFCLRCLPPEHMLPGTLAWSVMVPSPCLS